ncbi:hypothetical protein HBN50_13285 [Halobacteriovorax sp. GB3]|uniref:hypothetical protein n=1 Tax=Halobacteriovorax sp. GB3 TaxID=2719615 RepID=UPI002361A9EB|nr:hypothetical protein [Halobacteriovorax sp. GB3]MDD0854080.1 hypothetical protein [Halobacteriovorax sp. GB3]
MKLLFTLCFLISFQTLANDWYIQDKDGFFLLTSKEDKEHYYQLRDVGGGPEFQQVEILRGDIVKLIYNAGTAGTSAPISMIRAIVYNTKTKKFLGDYPLAYRSVMKMSFEQPQWQIKENILYVSDSNYDEIWTIKLP